MKDKSFISISYKKSLKITRSILSLVKIIEYNESNTKSSELWFIDENISFSVMDENIID